MSDIPELLEGSGLALWRKLNGELDFEPHEAQLAVELCRTVTLCEQLHRQLLAEGLVVQGQRGAKANPIMAELRQQRIVVARLTASLAILPGDGDGAAAGKPRGAARGVYTPQGARA